MKKIPKEIRIGAFNFTVDVVENNELKNGGTNYGDSDVGLLQIRLNKTAHIEQQISTLLHEVLHCIGVMNGLELKEKTICILEGNLFQVLKDMKDKF